MYHRPGTSDEKAINEVIGEHSYRKGFRGTQIVFDVLRGETWLDLGANIGAFTVFAGKQGATVQAYEPFDESFEVLKLNRTLHAVKGKDHQLAVVGGASGVATMSVMKNGNFWRNSIVKGKRGERSAAVCSVNIEEIITKEIDGVKLDVEGAEFEIIESVRNWRRVKKLVLEYSFDYDNDMKNFYRRMDILRKHFPFVRHAKFKEGMEKHTFFPPATMVFCLR